MEDLSFKSLAIAGMLLGIGVWMLGPKKEAERSLSAASQRATRLVGNTEGKVYQPNINSFAHTRDGDDKQLNLINDAAATTGPSPVQGASESSEFAQTRLEITRNLVHGDLDEA